MGNFKERLFYGNIKQELEHIFGVENIAGIERKNETTLPPEIFEKAKSDLNDTLQDTRERYDYFGVRNGSIQVIKQGIGPELEVTKNNVKGYIHMGLVKGIWDAFVAHPVPVLLHSHPNLTDEYIKSKNIKEVFKGLDIEQSKAYINMGSDYFSPQDLGYLEAKGKFIRSMLLASKGGYTFVINPNFNGFPNSLPFASLDYDRDYQRIFRFIVERMYQNKNTEIDRERWDRSLLQKLSDFCHKKGYVGFYNKDLNSPKLVTLRYIP